MSEPYESDIEDAFVAQAEAFGIEVLGQQVSVSTGIADVIGQMRTRPVVIEVKRGRAGESVLGQLLAYMRAVEVKMRKALPASYEHTMTSFDWLVEPIGIIVAKDLRKMTRRALGQFSSLRFIQYRAQDDGFMFSEVDVTSEWVDSEVPPPLNPKRDIQEASPVFQRLMKDAVEYYRRDMQGAHTWTDRARSYDRNASRWAEAETVLLHDFAEKETV